MLGLTECSTFFVDNSKTTYSTSSTLSDTVLLLNLKVPVTMWLVPYKRNYLYM